MTIRLKKIDEYVILDFIKAFFFSLITLMFIFLAFNLLDYLKIDSHQPRRLLYLAIIYSVPQIFVYVVFPAIMFSVSFVISRMTNDKEFVALFSSGISFYRVIMGIIILAFFISLSMFFIQNFIVVDFNKKSSEYLNQYKMNLKKMKAPSEVIFQKNLKGKDSYYFFHYFDPEKKEISGYFHIIYFKTVNDREIITKILESESAKYLSENNWKLFKIRELIFNDNLELTKVNFYIEKEIKFEENLDFFLNPNKNPGELSLIELKKEIEFRKKYSIDYEEYEAHYYANIAFPFIGVVIALIGAITGNMGTVRGGNPLIQSLFLSTLTLFLYQISFRVGLNLGETGIISPKFAGTGPLLLFLLFSFVLIFKHRR